MTSIAGAHIAPLIHKCLSTLAHSVFSASQTRLIWWFNDEKIVRCGYAASAARRSPCLVRHASCLTESPLNKLIQMSDEGCVRA
ncbi:hypothetical protein HMPREF3232_00414 [Fannyhessea vaginae]|nr:hypothetical protein HMPREF3232_00414 [Fannyhessea vaginae]